MSARSSSVPGLIVGPHDPTGRFTYWPHRFGRGGEVLAPAPPERPTQFVDVRDLAEWVVESLRARSRRDVQRDSSRASPGSSFWRRVAQVAGTELDDHLGSRRVPARARGRASGWSCRSGSPIRRWQARIGSTSIVPSPRAFASGRSQTPFAERSRLQRRRTPPASRRARGRAPRYVACPIRTTRGRPSRRSSARSRASGVVVFFTTDRDDLERRFEGLKATLDPADGLWIAWPKKAARIEGDLTFEAVQEIGLAHGLVDNKSCSIERRDFGSAVKIPRLEQGKQQQAGRAGSSGTCACRSSGRGDEGLCWRRRGRVRLSPSAARARSRRRRDRDDAPPADRPLPGREHDRGSERARQLGRLHNVGNLDVRQPRGALPAPSRRPRPRSRCPARARGTTKGRSRPSPRSTRTGGCRRHTRGRDRPCGALGGRRD